MFFFIDFFPKVFLGFQKWTNIFVHFHIVDKRVAKKNKKMLLVTFGLAHISHIFHLAPSAKIVKSFSRSGEKFVSKKWKQKFHRFHRKFKCFIIFYNFYI